jgi:tetratricopeptide (TPR) repeat protein
MSRRGEGIRTWLEMQPTGEKLGINGKSRVQKAQEIYGYPCILLIYNHLIKTNLNEPAVFQSPSDMRFAVVSPVGSYRTAGCELPTVDFVCGECQNRTARKTGQITEQSHYVVENKGQLKLSKATEAFPAPPGTQPDLNGTAKRLRRKSHLCHPIMLLAALILVRGWGWRSARAAGSPLGQSALGSPPPRFLTAGRTEAFRLGAGGAVVYSVHLIPGQYAEVRVEQSEGLIQAVAIDPSGQESTPYLLDAGKGSVVLLPLIANEAGEYRIHVSARVASPAVAGVVTLTQAHPATISDRLYAQACNNFARAEWIRKTGDGQTWREGLRNYDAAVDGARQLNDSKLARAALTGKARILLFGLADYPSARKVILKAAAIPDADRDLSGAALVWKTLSSAEYYLGNYNASIEAAKRALSLDQITGDRYWQGIVLGNLAYTYREIGEPGDSLAAARAALGIAQSIRDQIGIDFDLGTMAAAHMARGEFEQALNLYYRAVDECGKQPYPEAEANDWLGLGDIYTQLGDADRARQAFERAVLFSEKAHDSADELNAFGFLGDLELQRHHPKEAEEYYRRGLITAQAQQLLPEETFLLVQLGEAEAAAGNHALAMTAVQKGLDIAESISELSGEGRAFQALGDLYASAGQPAQASAQYRKAYRIWSQEGHRVRMAVALASLAQTDFVSDRLRTADTKIEAALNLIESSRARIVSQDLRTSYFGSKHSYYDLAVNILMDLNRLYPQKGYDARAMAMAERARARTLLDALEESPGHAYRNVPAQLLVRQQHVREQLDAAYSRLRKAMGGQPQSALVIHRVEQQIENLLHEGDTMESRIREADPRYAVLARGEPVDLPQLERAMGNHTAVLEYWLGARRSFLWLLTHGHLASFELPPSRDLVSLVKQYRNDLLARVQYPPGEDFFRRHRRVALADIRANQEGIKLGRLLLGPTSRVPSLQTLLIVPDGSLWLVPFAALRLPADTSNAISSPLPGRVVESKLKTAPSFLRSNRAVDENAATKFSDDKTEFAIARFCIAEEPSASVLLSLMARTRPGETDNPRVAIFADPVYTAGDPRLVSRMLIAQAPGRDNPPARIATLTRWSSETGIGELPRLSGARQEALEIAALAGLSRVELRMGFDARPEAVQQTNWSRYPIAHFADHAIINPVHAAFSGIVLSMVDRRGNPEDGVLWLNDIYDLRMPVSLVVLSACRTSVGLEIPGEGVAGLARAFFFAGSQRVIGSLWSIEDQETSYVMEIFYRDLLKKHSTAAASLRAAQLEMTRNQKWCAPYFWAGIALQGAPN